MKIIIDRTAR